MTFDGNFTKATGLDGLLHSIFYTLQGFLSIQAKVNVCLDTKHYKTQFAQK